MKRVTIRVPATTANLGPGFDAFGCALSLYTDVTFEETDCGLEITGCDEEFTGPDNMAYTSYCAVLASLSEEVRGVKIHIESQIPVCRGLGSSAALLLNALKALAGIPDEAKLISREIIEPIQHLKVDHLGNKNPRLHTDEVLLALSICAVTDSQAEAAMEQLGNLRGCQVHSTVLLSQVDERTFRKLGVHLTCEPKYQTEKFYHA